MATTTPIRALGEIALQVRDLDTMQAFYENVVGLEVLRRFPGIVFFKIAEGYAGHTQVLALFDRGAPYDDRDGFRRPPLDHIAFSVDRAGLAAEEARLEALGVELTRATHGWVQWRSLYIQDPEGNQVEWVCYDPEVQRD
jgi:catechol 2,3-dioxygenase